MPVTWLHVSDFHLSDKGPYDQDVILRALVISMKRFRNQGVIPDLIFATGDIAQSGKTKEYDSATKFFDDLLDAAGLNRDRLFIVPGNHDVDRKSGKFFARTLDTKEDADEYFDPDSPIAHLSQKFHAFSEWYNDYFKAIRSFPTNTTCSPVEIVTINNCRIAVLPLNSALFCIDDHDQHKLFIGRRCLDEAKRQLAAADLTVALIHHPLDWLSPIERANIKSALAESVDLVLQGHYHETELEGIVSANGGYLKLAAGAAYQKREWPNTAMYATFDGNQVTIFPIRYEDSPNEKWTLDTSLFPSPSYTKSFLIPGRPDHSSVTSPESGKQHQRSAERYQAMLKQELGYIRMLGMPGIESVKVNLNDDTFVPLRLSNRKATAELSSERRQPLEHDHILFPDDIIKQVFHDGRKRRMLLVLGDLGAGKTTLLKYYALSAFEDHKRLGFTGPVNVFYLPLRDLVHDKEGRYDTLPANLASWSANQHQTIDVSIFDDWLNTGTSLVLLDGLDEISNTTERIEVCRWIDGAWSGFNKAFFVVTSRFTGYNKEEGVELEAEYERADVQDFTQEQQQRFLLNWFTAAFLKEPGENGYDESSWEEKQKATAEERTTAILAHLNAAKNKGLRQLAAIPMMLQIMAILWKDRDYMPESRVKLYEAALDYLLEFRDKRRNIKPLLSAMRARQVLAPVSLWMQETLKKEEVSKADMHTVMQEKLDMLDNPPTAEAFCDALIKRAGLFIESGDKEYLFRHKSFREYLAGYQLKEDRAYEHLNKLVNNFGEDWWEEPLRFFIGSVDAKVFDAFMAKLFDSPVSADLTQKQQLLLQTLIEEARGKKVDALCKKLLDPETTSSRQRVILDCLKSIGKPAALESLHQFSIKSLAKNRDVADRAQEVFFALGGKIHDFGFEKLMSGKRLSFQNQNENYAVYPLIPGGSYIYSITQQEERVEDLYIAKYPVSNKLYRSFIASLQAQGSDHDFPVLLSVFSAELNVIAQNNSWGAEFAKYLKESKSLADLFRSKFDEDRKFDGDDQPVIGVTWYAARAYCLWLSMLEGEVNRYRLPTEIEWEWAAGGQQGTIGKSIRTYPWKDTKGKPTSMLANHARIIGATTPVGACPDGATPEGLYDMAGNVWEWMENRYDDGKKRYALRGGAWDVSADNLRCSCRNFNYPYLKESNYGFRVVRSSHSVQEQSINPETEKFYRTALSIIRKGEYNDHPSEAAFLNDFVGLLQEQGKYAEAESLAKHALMILEKWMGTDHPSVATSLNNIAGLLQVQGKYVEAEALYRRSLEIVEKTLGNEHPAIATSLNNLARLLRVQSKYAEAESLYNRAFSINSDISPLYVPSDLVNACLKGENVAFVGSGIGARAGLLTWVELVEGLLSEAVTAGLMDAKNLQLQRAALREGEVNVVADNVVSAFGLERKALQDFYRRMNVSEGQLPRTYHLLSTIPFSAILTSNYDDLLDQVLEGSAYERGLTPSNSERLLELLASRKTPFLLKLYGDLSRPETLILAPTEYQNFVYSNIGFARFMEGLFFSRTLLFIGTSLEGLTDYLSVFRFPSELLVRHYALVAVSGRGWEAKAEVLQRRYNIVVIPFRPSAGFTEVDTFLEELTQSVAQRKRDADTSLAAPFGTRLKKVTLENIGPFERLELDFEDNWKILLGDNGVGKTSILKAIAVAIVGSEARHFAEPLLRVGQTLGSIRLVTLENPTGYLVEIQRVGSGVEVVSYFGRALEAEGWVAIGFPPLRATTWSPTQGPQGISVKRPNADDLLPLVRGGPDIRMDDLKQWIVNTEALSRREGAPEIDRKRSDVVLNSFFNIVNELIDQSIKKFEVTSDFRVLVKTNDGQIPIESLSQGMTSLLSWVGILLQRLYEVHYDNSHVTDPTQEYALVLMDEIDAHMHPKWQQTLVAKLKKIFPNVQVIASTHSPLVVAGMPVSQIVRFERNEDGQVETARIDDDMSIGRTDQVLTGDLFGLDTTLALDVETNSLMDEYKSLLAKRQRNNKEDNRFYELHRTLADRIPPTSETKLERRAYELALAVLMSDFRPENILELKSTLLQKVKEVGESMGWGDLS